MGERPNAKPLATNEEGIVPLSDEDTVAGTDDAAVKAINAATCKA